MNGRLHYMIALMILALFLPAGCSAKPGSTESETVTVFAAASLTDAFSELADVLEAERPGSAVVLNFAGSNQLATQISQGAPADVFASADEVQMAAVVADGRINPAAPVAFAANRLIIIYPATNPANIQSPQDLAQEGLLLVLAAPEVPVGRYSRAFLDRAANDSAFGPDFSEAVLANLVSNEQNVRAVLTKVMLGEADAGIVYASDVTGETADRLGQLDIPDELNVIAHYPIAPLTDSAQPEAASAFVDLVLSPAGQEILARNGFEPPKVP